MRGTGMGAAVWIGGKRRTYCRALQSCTPYSVSNCTVYYVLQYCVRTVAHDTTAVLRCTAVSKALPQGEGLPEAEPWRMGMARARLNLVALS